jgi:inositol oxygenase
MAPGDEALLAAVRDFNQFDLYSKGDARPDVGALWPHYQALIDEYMPGQLEW